MRRNVSRRGKKGENFLTEREKYKETFLEEGEVVEVRYENKRRVERKGGGNFNRK